ncbi:MAG TPA: alpha/beta hydrolase [Streptosporangiaceae bacterium]|nr:alpha/beta hydrolase [Streptosporangiaceae bacterium]
MTQPTGPADTLVAPDGSAAADAGTSPSSPAGAAPILPWPGELVRLEVGDVFVRRTEVPPGAEPALFVHGLGGSALNWTDLMGLLAEPVGATGAGPAAPPLAGAALDLPGFGFSPPPGDGDYSLDARVAAVTSLIDKRGCAPVHLIGNSLGGAICTRVAARRPDLVRTLTLISPALPDLRPRPLPLRIAVVALPGLGRWLLTRMKSIPPERRADTSIAGLYLDPARLLPERRAEAIAEVARRDGLGYAVDALYGSARSLLTEYTRPGAMSLWADAARVTAPTLLLHGSHDRLVNPAMSGRAARTFPDCRVVVLPRVGHVAMMERPAETVAEIREFLRRGSSGGRPSGSAQRPPATAENRAPVSAVSR